MRDIWPDKSLGCLLSIGTGLGGPRYDMPKGFIGILQTLERIATESEHTAEGFLHEHQDLHNSGLYYRFNFMQGLENVKFSEWKQASLIANVTRNYPNGQEEFQRIKSCVGWLQAIHPGKSFPNDHSQHQKINAPPPRLAAGVNDLKVDPSGLKIVWPKEQSDSEGRLCQVE